MAAPGSLGDGRTRRSGDFTVALTINKNPYQLSLDPRTTLLDLLREELALTGTNCLENESIHV